MKTKSLLAGIGVALLVLGFAWPSTAQTAPGVYADANSPAGAPDPEKLDQIWQVDPLTGAVNITIPFTTTPAGGRGPKIPFSLHYNSSSTVTLQYHFTVAATANNPISIQFYGWSTGQIHPVNTDPPQSPLGPWTTSGPFFYSHATFLQGGQITYYLPNGPVYTPVYTGCAIDGPFIYTDTNGAAHDMNLETTTAGNSPSNTQLCMNAYWDSLTYGSNFYTTDGSALATTFSPLSVVQPNGTRVSGGTLEDSNGNQATFGPNASGVTTATDSLGRTAFSTTIPINYMGQIPVGNYNVTTTGASGNSELYSVAFSQISIGSFTMPHPVGGPVGSPNSEMTGSDTSLGAEQPTTEGINTTLPVVSSITLPNNTQYVFTYDQTYGTISRITFPTGGYVRFVWGIRGDGGSNSAPFLKLSTIVVTEACTSSGSGAESCWQYSFPDYSLTTGLTSTVTAPDGTYTMYTGVGMNYSAVPISYSLARSWKEASRLEYNSSGQLMKSVATTYYRDGSTYQIATTLYDGPTPLQQYVQYVRDGYANVWEKDESDFYSCTISGNSCPMPATLPSILRSTYTSYAYASNPAMAAAHIVDKPSQVLVTDGSGNPVSLTSYSYDSRGNMLSESKCISGISFTTSSNSWTATCGGSSWTTSYYYDLTGQLTCKVDGPGQGSNQVAGCPVAGLATTSYTWGGQNNGFLTKVQHPDGTTDQYTYWQPIGAIYQHTDVNNQTTTYNYESYLNRIASIILPATTDGTTGSSAQGTTTYTYTDAAEAFSVQEQHLMTGSTWTSVTKQYDGLGRAVTTLASSPQCTIETDTVYDSMSRVYSVSNPYCSSSDPTYGLTYFAYDGLGRKTQTTLPDGSVSKITYAGNATETTDPFNGTTNVQHIQQVDGLGRLTNVCEVGLAPQATGGPQACGLNIAGSGSLTTYIYDPLGNMLSVNQHGLSRTFNYDALSRLLCASNPENSFAACPVTNTGAYVTGTDTYTYSNSSNACSPSAGVPCTRTDARGVKTSYTYDSMSRLTSKSYSAASGNTTGGVSDMTTCYVYNTTTGFPDSNPLSVLRFVWQQPQSAGSCSSWPPSSAVGVRFFSNHDAMGRVGHDTQCLAMTSQYCSTTTGQFLYSYNLLGDPVQANNGIAPSSTVTATQTVSSSGNGTPITAPSLTWMTTYDNANRILQVGVQDQPSYATGTTPAPVFPSTTYSIAPTLLKAINYDPFGHMTGGQLGIPNGASTAAISIARQYDNRGRENLELDMGYNASNTATNSVGAVAVSGVEQGPAYPVSSYPKTTVTVSGSERQTTTNPCQACQQYGCPPCPQTVYDQGTATLTVNGMTVSAYYDYGWDPSRIASTLASTINGKVSGVVVTSSGSTITIRSTKTGTAMNGTGSVSASSSTNSTLSAFVGTSFPVSVSSSTLAGGYNTTPSVYDAGTISVTINGAAASVPFGQSSTPQSIATALNTAIQNVAGSFVNAKLDGDSSLLVSNSTGSSTDWQITAAVTYDSTDFTAPSFLVTTGAMAEGYSAASGQGPAYFYYVPEGGYAPNGNILMHSDSVMGDWAFSYDAMDRLSTAAQFAATPTSQQFAGVNGSWSYDSYGNRTAQSFSGNNTFSNWATYNSTNNRIATASTAVAGYVYDASGNTLNDGNNKYWYDAEGQLCAVQSLAVTGLPITQYIYDGMGARIGKGTLSAAPPNSTSLCAPPFSSGFTLTARYLVDQGGNQVTELSEQSGEVWKHSNVFSAARLTATYDYNGGNGGLHYELADPLGTKRVQASTSGAVEMSWISLPFGDALTPIPPLNPPSTADDATEHHFTGKERDTESGNDYFEARYYSSSFGRFISPDWSATEEPVPYAKLDYPQSLNLYAYVLNNPITHVDMDGHCWGGGWCDQHGNPDQTDSEKEAAMKAAQSQGPWNTPFVQTVMTETSGTVEYGKEAFNWLSLTPYVGSLFAIDSAVVSAFQGNTGETAVSSLAAIPAVGLLGKGGKFAELLSLSEPLDNIALHHMPQVALDFTSKSAGGALAIETGEHVATRTYGFKGALTAIDDTTKSFRQVLARDIHDIRSIAGSKYNEGLQSTINYYKQNFPSLISK